ncbi:MAG: TRAP transporter small permease subunit [Flavobacteriaceae bacterium]
MIDIFDRITGGLARILLVLGCIMLVVMAFHVTTDVAMRYFFNMPFEATLELGTYYYMVSASFLALGFAQLHDKHISVDFLLYGLSPRRRMFVELLALILTAAMVGLIAYMVTISAIEKTQTGEFQQLQHFDLPVWPSRWILAVSQYVFLLALLTQISRSIAAALKGEIYELPKESIADEIEAGRAA